MGFPQTRLRRLRMNSGIRSLVSETRLHTENFIMPLFVVPGSGIKTEIQGMPGQFHLSVDQLLEKAKSLFDLGIKAVLLFGLPEKKDDTGLVACSDNGIIQKALESLKKTLPSLTLITDLCFCEYTTHGHCGVIKDGVLDNDSTLSLLLKQGLSHARAGADMLAPSGMLDGTVKFLRQGLDEQGFYELPIMSYSAKFASAFYEPFRDAVKSAPQFGDRRSYQMNPSNANEAMREIELDISEGADIVMIKPALAYLDIIKAAKQKFLVPIAAYNVSGEYSMIKSAAKQGLIDEKRIMLETLISVKRAGANIIISYFAEDVARLSQGGSLSL
jgi:porphobilinogen synthase